MRRITAVWLGRRRYREVHALQHVLHTRRREGTIGDVLLLLEHHPVITKGRGAHAANILTSEQALTREGIDLAETARGGDVTLHAPGQLVAYPIFDLNPDRRDVRRYVGDLTQVMQRLARDEGIESGPVDGMVGLWVNTEDPTQWAAPSANGSTPIAKVGAIGVRLSRWVSMHGFALNVSIELDLYRYIVPCGISTYPVTSLRQLRSDVAPVATTAERARKHFAQLFDAEVTPLLDRSSAPLDPTALF